MSNGRSTKIRHVYQSLRPAQREVPDSLSSNLSLGGTGKAASFSHLGRHSPSQEGQGEIKGTCSC